MDSSAIFLRPEEKTDALVTLAKVEARLAALRFRILAVADEACDDGAYRTVTDLVSHRLHEDRVRVKADTALAELLERFEIVAAALAAGALSVSKARVIAYQLEELERDPEIDADVVNRAEQHLVSLAPDFTTSEIRRLAAKVVDVVAPWIGEERERKKLEAAERRALRRLSLKFHNNPDGLEGVTELRARIPTTVAGRLRTYLEAFTAPRHLNTTNAATSIWTESALGEHVPYEQRLATAFCSMLETIDPERLPIHGGTATSIVVTMSLDALRSGLGVGEATGGSGGETSISAAQVRRLACTANIIPAVLGAKSEILDLGRSARLFSPAQRRAMAIRDKRCRAEGCSIPADWCEAHHYKQPWSHGGHTNLADGKLLCPRHHHRAHDTRYIVNELPNGDIRYTRRT